MKKMTFTLLSSTLISGTIFMGQPTVSAAGQDGIIEKSVHFKQLMSGTSKSIIDAGMKYLGTPYVFGSSRSNTQSFDCSDFVRQAFKDGAGVILPGNSRTQANYVKKIGNTTTNWRNLKPGDIMFFISYNGSKSSNYTSLNKSGQRITHNGIYLGNGKILQTYSKESVGFESIQLKVSIGNIDLYLADAP